MYLSHYFHPINCIFREEMNWNGLRLFGIVMELGYNGLGL
jgi:hypothetical protein